MCGAEVEAVLHIPQAFVVTGRQVAALYPQLFSMAHFELKEGEKAKSWRELKRLLISMKRAGLSRKQTVVAVGGGAVLDAAGFAASVYLRGVDWIAVPTTLLAMADSSMGGKTAIDFMNIKNLLGSFHLPAKRIIDTSFLHTLPAAEWDSGMGEVVKSALLNRELYEFLCGREGRIAGWREQEWQKAIEYCAQTKNYYIEGDYQDKNGRRVALNIGHTVGHALEAAYNLKHGIAVLYGIGIEAAMFKDIIDPGFYRQIGALVTPLLKPRQFSAERLVGYLKHDKKNDGGIAVVVAQDFARPSRLELSENEFMGRLKACL